MHFWLACRPPTGLLAARKRVCFFPIPPGSLCSPSSLYTREACLLLCTPKGSLVQRELDLSVYTQIKTEGLSFAPASCKFPPLFLLIAIGSFEPRDDPVVFVYKKLSFPRE